MDISVYTKHFPLWANQFATHIQKIDPHTSFLNPTWADFDTCLDFLDRPEKGMFNAFSKDAAFSIAYSINEFILTIQKIKAWNEVLKGLDKNAKLALQHYFVDDVVISGLSLPYAVKSRLFFFVAHTSHRANVVCVPGWKDDFSTLPQDQSIKEENAHRASRNWPEWKNLIRKLNNCNGYDFKKSTNDFRNLYNHRINPGIEYGFFRNLSRIEIKDDDGLERIGYSFFSSSPVSIDAIISPLENEGIKLKDAYEAYKSMILEQKSCVDAA